jgi:hypothetical protein
MRSELTSDPTGAPAGTGCVVHFPRSTRGRSVRLQKGAVDSIRVRQLDGSRLSAAPTHRDDPLGFRLLKTTNSCWIDLVEVDDALAIPHRTYPALCAADQVRICAVMRGCEAPMW